MMKSLKLPSVLFTLMLAQATAANPLYSWTTADGTPTYSPDPPPKGVSYEIVGPDLQPLQGQPVNPAQAAAAPSAPQVPPATNQAASGSNGNLVLTPAPGSSAQPSSAQSGTQAPKTTSAWKPVVYANDPNPQAVKSEPAIAAAAPAVAAPSVNQPSPECVNLSQQLALLESQFANAFSAQQMDNAIVRLHDFRNQNKGNCGL